MYESPRHRSMEEIATPHSQQRHLLSIQEINRKGRISPLPQAVQGAQPQLAGPAGEPGIKSEFGRMFSGIGTGVGNMSSPVPSGAQLPYAAPGLLRREDSDGVPPEPLGGDTSAKGGQPNRGKRRKQQKEDDVRGDEESTGRLTPVGARAKKAKTHSHHHHQYAPSGPLYYLSSNLHSHHHHPHHHSLDQNPPSALPGNTPFKSAKGSTPVPSPTAVFAKDFPTHHHVVPRSAANNHSHAAAAKAAPAPPPTPPPAVVPKPRQVASSKAVLESVADRPRTHLGDVLYDPILKSAGRPPRSGFKSTPRPLPWDLIEGKENSTLTMKIGKEHLTPAAREEITMRRALWGTDVYTDDSDVIAACIHAGWIRGEWPEDVDVDMLGLDEGFCVSDARDTKDLLQTAQNGAVNAPADAVSTVLTEPPSEGPMPVPENRDLHVTLLILPTLKKYASTTRYGIRSREFGGLVGDHEEPQMRAVHDGISFMVIGLRWVTNGGVSQNRLRGKERRERIRKALREVELGPAWAGGARNTIESRENGTGGEKAGEISGAWWKQSSKPPSEGDKENQPENEKAGRSDKATEGDSADKAAIEKAVADQEPVEGDGAKQDGQAGLTEAAAEA